MARALRIEYEGAIYHVMARGNLRQDIFRSPRDRFRFLDKQEETVERHHLLPRMVLLITGGSDAAQAFELLDDCHPRLSNTTYI